MLRSKGLNLGRSYRSLKGLGRLDFGKLDSSHPQIFHAGYFDLQVAIFKLFALVWDVSEYFQNKPRYSIVFAFRKCDS